ncbi:MAG: tRNA uridine-5-carboxymethylaminomethyl(34) synthesis GTPase MnmE, partial [Paludibacter sp.]|nr:tRNA uridine-5-carboxymethylaminomethyl(34) synthesis GTPase MnmE [Paludibacter sp.]
MYYSETTICAISTPPGMGGIAVIRLSGPAAFSICDKIFFPARKEASLSEAKSHTL